MTVPWTRQVEQELHCFTCRRRQAALLFSGYEARARWYPLLQGSRLAAIAISISILYSRVWFCAPSEACFGDLVVESMGDWEKESAVWPLLPFQWVWRCVSLWRQMRWTRKEFEERMSTFVPTPAVVVAFAQYAVTKTWRLKKRTCGKLWGRPGRRPRTFEGDAQGPCMSSVQLLSSCQKVHFWALHILLSIQRCDNGSSNEKKKRQTPLTTPRKRSFESRCQRRKRDVLSRSAVWRRIEWVHQSANDKTTTRPPSCRLSLKKLLRPGWPRAERGHHSAVRGLPMNFRDLSWWPPLFFPTQNG